MPGAQFILPLAFIVRGAGLGAGAGVEGGRRTRGTGTGTHFILPPALIAREAGLGAGAGVEGGVGAGVIFYPSEELGEYAVNYGR